MVESHGGIVLAEPNAGETRTPSEIHSTVLWEKALVGEERRKGFAALSSKTPDCRLDFSQYPNFESGGPTSALLARF